MAIERVNGVDFYYELHGAGEPLVFVHGYTGDVTDWRFQIPEFSRSHRVLVFDHRGHGRSSAPADRAAYSIEQMADDVEALAGRAGFARYHLVGHSMGGAVVQEVALRSPGRLMSLTLHDTGPTFNLHRNAAVAAYIAQRQKLAEERGMAAVAEQPSPLPPPPHMPPEREEEMRRRLAAMPVDGFIGAWQALATWRGTTDRAAAIATPTMVIYGELDAGLIDGARYLAETIPGAVLEVVPEAGHSPQYERPELFNAALRRHLERNAGASAK
ncbi:MAG TPA: alpha/beta fold hydrolase [Dehalococcoidia bacterium]|nr:alpha/beta fold hydrolase [Dehalococcoidia bacterium]